MLHFKFLPLNFWYIYPISNCFDEWSHLFLKFIHGVCVILNNNISAPTEENILVREYLKNTRKTDGINNKVIHKKILISAILDPLYDRRNSDLVEEKTLFTSSYNWTSEIAFRNISAIIKLNEQSKRLLSK